jgi:predicted O-methyltransferase YrrM
VKYDASNVPPHVWAALRDADRWGPEQHGDELAPFAMMVAELNPRHVLEIGVRKGGTAAVWHGLSTGYVIGMDLPGDSFNEKRAHELWEAYPRYWGMLHDSHTLEALAEVKRRLVGEPLDLLFHDGDHSAEGVRKDFEMYAPLVRKGGIVAFHDIVDHPACAVKPFWDSLQGDKVEFNIHAPWGGIGAIRC